MLYHLDDWILRRWESSSRYYCAEVIPDLFGDWVVRRSWGSLGARRGSSKVQPMPDYAAAVRELETIDQRRRRRGYQRV